MPSEDKETHGILQIIHNRGPVYDITGDDELNDDDVRNSKKVDNFCLVGWRWYKRLWFIGWWRVWQLLGWRQFFWYGIIFVNKKLNLF